jgi:hypothetical protein
LLEKIQIHSEENRVSFGAVTYIKPVKYCPHTERENRNKEEFKCLKCGYLEQADYVGSLNILHRFLIGPYGADFKTEPILSNTIG